MHTKWLSAKFSVVYYYVANHEGELRIGLPYKLCMLCIQKLFNYMYAHTYMHTHSHTCAHSLTNTHTQTLTSLESFVFANTATA